MFYGAKIAIIVFSITLTTDIINIDNQDRKFSEFLRIPSIFSGNSSGGGSTCPTVGQAQNPVMGQPQNPVMAPSVTESTTPKPYTVTQEPYTTTVSAG